MARLSEFTVVFSYKFSLKIKPILRKVAGWSGSAKGDAAFRIWNKIDRLHSLNGKPDTSVGMDDLIPARNAIYAFMKGLEQHPESAEYKQWYENAIWALSKIDSAIGSDVVDLPRIEGTKLILGSLQTIENNKIIAGGIELVGNKMELPDATHVIIYADDEESEGE